jgi:hypothetical protein
MAWPFFAPFRRLLRLAGSRWRYSTPPPHGFGQALNLVWLIAPRQRQRNKHGSSTVAPNHMSAKTSPSNGRVHLLIKNLLPSSECCFADCFEASIYQRLYTLCNTTALYIPPLRWYPSTRPYDVITVETITMKLSALIYK